MVKYDLLVYLGLVPVVAVIMFAGFVIWSTPLNVHIETRKIRRRDLAWAFGPVGVRCDSILRRRGRRR